MLERQAAAQAAGLAKEDKAGPAVEAEAVLVLGDRAAPGAARRQRKIDDAAEAVAAAMAVSLVTSRAARKARSKLDPVAPLHKSGAFAYVRSAFPQTSSSDAAAGAPQEPIE
jgi:hypothetical protein